MSFEAKATCIDFLNEVCALGRLEQFLNLFHMAGQSMHLVLLRKEMKLQRVKLIKLLKPCASKMLLTRERGGNDGLIYASICLKNRPYCRGCEAVKLFGVEVETEI